MHLTLFIPDLLPAPGLLPSAGTAPVLRRLFGRAHPRRSAATGSEAWLCRTFGVDQQQHWPVAPLTAALDGLDAGSGLWLRADPVHLQLQRGRTLVIAAPALSIDHGESAALTATLNRHFAADGLVFHALQPSRWHLGTGDLPDDDALTLDSLAGRPLPRAQWRGTWHRRLTEIQMLLHDHPVNQAREARGVPVINSLLLWGGGCKPAVSACPYTRVWSGDPLAGALALAARISCVPAPGSADAWLAALQDDSNPAARHLLTLESVHHAARYSGLEAWQQAVTAVDIDWIAPLCRALRHALTTLEIVATGPAQTLQVTARGADRFRFWRRTPAWADLAGMPS